MGSNHNHPVEADPQAVQHANELWSNFTKMTTVSVIAIIAVLGLMAFFLV